MLTKCSRRFCSNAGTKSEMPRKQTDSAPLVPFALAPFSLTSQSAMVSAMLPVVARGAVHQLISEEERYYDI